MSESLTPVDQRSTEPDGLITVSRTYRVTLLGENGDIEVDLDVTATTPMTTDSYETEPACTEQSPINLAVESLQIGDIYYPPDHLVGALLSQCRQQISSDLDNERHSLALGALLEFE